jgi:addiction module HigA family antidote
LSIAGRTGLRRPIEGQILRPFFAGDAHEAEIADYHRGVPPRRINEIVRGQRSLTADTALRLARFFRTTERFWLNLQTRYDLEVQKDRLGDRLDREVTTLASPD